MVSPVRIFNKHEVNTRQARDIKTQQKNTTEQLTATHAKTIRYDDSLDLKLRNTEATEVIKTTGRTSKETVLP